MFDVLAINEIFSTYYFEQLETICIPALNPLRPGIRMTTYALTRFEDSGAIEAIYLIRFGFICEYRQKSS